MQIQENGVLSRSVRYLFTPSSFAEQVLFYPTRMGHYFCTDAYLFDNNNLIALQPSHHFHYMMFLIKRGTMAVNLDGRTDQARSGDIVVFDCKAPHAYRASSEKLEFYWLVFDGISCDILFRKIKEQHEDRNVFPSAAPSETELLLERLITIAGQAGHPAVTDISELIYSILCSLLQRSTGKESHKGGLIEGGMYYMDTHYKEQISVEDVAAAVGLSASYFTKCFRLQTGYSPHEYLSLRRISRAKELLLSSGSTVKEIAFDVGYASQENFIRSFKKSVGVSPAAYRRYPI
ncbi:MAG: AraC family transcriptional regulator [Lachnospiraceae bacterium]|nr:AraC family transcriptional regulator [Lachnospiraceae bacterium]